MRKIFLFTLILVSMIAPAQQVSHGQLKSFPKFSSEHIGERTIAVWLPENYTSEQSYPTLYMHDGQMLFDAKTTWNGQEWGIDEVANRLIQQGDVPPFIVVGIWNAGPIRHSEYFPQKPFELLKESARDSILEYSKRGKEALFKKPIQSDAYLKFLTQELKPFIDKNFATRPGPENTFLMGSSMGGLISWYALCEYPDIFGGAACMSTHWPGGFVYEDNPIPDSFIDYLDKNLPPPAKHRLYFDLGDATLDANYPPLQQKVDLLMAKKGYGPALWTTRFFPGENHSEEAWNKRLHEPLIFLFNPNK